MMKKPMNKLVVYDENEHLKHPYHTISFNTSKISVKKLKDEIKNLLNCRKVYLTLYKYYTADRVDGEIITDRYMDSELTDKHIVPSKLYNKKFRYTSRSPEDESQKRHDYISFSRV